MKRLVVIVIVGLAVLLMAACAENEPSVEIVGPAQAKVETDIYLEAKATGATPAFGQVLFNWERRSGATGSWEDVRSNVVSTDVNGNAIEWWVDKMPSAPGTIQYRVTAHIWQTHDRDQVVFRVDTHEVKVVESPT